MRWWLLWLYLGVGSSGPPKWPGGGTLARSGATGTLSRAGTSGTLNRSGPIGTLSRRASA